jgi:hypothetical protein
LKDYLNSAFWSWPNLRLFHIFHDRNFLPRMNIAVTSILDERFRISVTYEMRTTEYGEICISIDTHTVAERA